MKVTATTPAATRALGRALAELLEPGDTLLFAGALGAGKTELAKGVAEGLGVREPVVSPTFTIAREYVGRLHLVHVDVYRLDHMQEVLDLGLEDVPDDAVTIVEWGDVVSRSLPADHLLVTIEMGDQDEERHVVLEPRGTSWAKRAGRISALEVTTGDRS